VLDEIRRLIRLLGHNPLSVDEVIAATGEIETDYGSNVVMRPKLAAFRQINIVRRYETDEISYVTLKLSKPFPLNHLTGEFGTGKRITGGSQQPPRMIFYLPQPDAPYDIALAATLRDDMVTEIMLRRDTH
jgi:hypothetical protein